MAEEDHDPLGELFEQAVELSPNARSRFVESCSEDPTVRTKLRSLLAAHDRAPNFLERLADKVMPTALQAVAEDNGYRSPAARQTQPLAPIAATAGGAATRLEPDSRLGSYEIQGRIAAGGNGIVYRAFDTELQRPVAIKTLAWTTPDARDALLREARSASALNHPRICTIYEVGEHDGVPFIAMEYIDGQPLRDVIPSEGLPAELVVRYGCQVAEAVDHAHRHGIIHRDLKSTNVMIAAESQAKVLDFGLASRIPAAQPETSTHSCTAQALAGTLAYLAPELLRGAAADKRSDVWALGVLLYEMAAGRLPFLGATPLELTAAILERTPAPLSAKLPVPLRALIGRCLARDTAQRYQHGGELRVALETLQFDTDPSQALRQQVPETATGRSSASRTRYRRAAIAMLLLVAVLGIAISTSMIRSRRTEVEEVQLTTNSSEAPVTAAAISPDGKYFAYADDGGLHVRVIESRETHTVPVPDTSSINRLAWFPDGIRLLVSADPTTAAGTPSIWSVSLIGGSPRKLHDDGMEGFVSPDGTRITFVDGRRTAVWVMGPGGEDPYRAVSASAGDEFHLPSFWWNGSRHVYGRFRLLEGKSGDLKMDVSLEARDGDGHTLVLLSDPGLRGAIRLPDGRLIYSLVAQPVLNRGGTLWETDADPLTGLPTGKPRQIHMSSDGPALWQFSSTADGTRVAIVKRSPQMDVYVADLPSALPVNPRRLTLDESDDFATNWTPDSRTVLFTSDRNGTRDIFKQAFDQRTPEAVVTGPDDDSGPTAVTPDGAWYYYLVNSRGWMSTWLRRTTIMRISASGGSPERVSMGPAFQLVLCGHRGSHTCVLAEREGTRLQIAALDPLHGKGGRLATIELGSEVFTPLALSPDGSRLAVEMVSERRMRIVSLRGEPDREVPLGDRQLIAAAFFWSADGAGWYVSSTSPGKASGTDLLHVDLNGDVSLVWHQATDSWMSAIPSPDGRHLALSRANMVSNVWMIKGL
jgi:serine/threonine protein kinase